MAYQSILKQIREDEENVARLNEKLTANNTLSDNQKKVITDTYNNQIEESSADYENEHRENAVQKKVNEFYIAEEMANMGLTNSGLNRTQITANQLSYANNKADIDKRRQSMVESLTQEMNAKLAEIEITRLSSEQSIKDTWESDNQTAAQSVYKEQLAQQTELAKAALDASANKTLYTFLREETDDNLNEYMVYEGSDGKEHKVAKGINPYTGENSLLRYADAAKEGGYGFFSNGYQPKGVYYNGQDYGKVIDSGVTTDITGKNQKVWTTGAGEYWIWDGSKNSYIPYDSSEVAVKPKQTSNTDALVKEIEKEIKSYATRTVNGLRFGEEHIRTHTGPLIADSIITNTNIKLNDGELLYLIQKYNIK